MEEEAKEISQDEALTIRWNQFIEALIEVRDQWESLSDLITNDRPGLEALPMPAQKGLAKFGRQKFTVAIPRIVDYSRSAGGLEPMLAKD